MNLPTIGTELDGGVFWGVTTRSDGTHCAVVLLPDKSAMKLTWSAAMAWAAELSAELPTRPVSALLFANARSQFDPEWYWTSEEQENSCASIQHFRFGTQIIDHIGAEGRARAVRLIPL